MKAVRPATILLLSFLLLLLGSLCSSVEINGEDLTRSHFPDGFLFGTATSAYQIEGAYLADGKGLGIWDVYTHIPGKVENNNNGDIADDHYHLFLEDIEIMHSLGVNAYRFSISWERILPKGRFGEVNQAGIKFYNKIIGNLLLRGIEPFVTIFHHDLPQELEDRYGSWLSPLIQEDFVHLARICFENFGDRVKYWTTLNEPNLLTEMSYIRGWYPPARCSPPFGNCSAGNSDKEPLLVLHNMIISHGKAVDLYRRQFQSKQGGSIGIIVNANMYEPLRDNVLDQDAVRRILAFNTAWLLDPIVFGDYPSEMKEYLGNDLPRFSQEETKFIKGSIDFIGINHYVTEYARDCIYSTCAPQGYRPIRGFTNSTPYRDGILIGEPTGIYPFCVVPRGMENIIGYIKDRYNNIPMYVTENGYSQSWEKNEPSPEVLQDIKRIEYHKSYLASVARAMRNGADVRGYFIWSLIDNLEWISGYEKRFGLYYVDRQTLERIPKLSAAWYKSFLNNVTYPVDSDARLSRKTKFIVTKSENERIAE